MLTRETPVDQPHQQNKFLLGDTLDVLPHSIWAASLWLVRIRVCVRLSNQMTLLRSWVDPLGRGFLRCGGQIAFIVLVLGFMTSSLWDAVMVIPECT
jgi:hypothetical protein